MGILHGVGFEPTHPKIVDLKSTALDHSAIRAFIDPHHPINIIKYPYDHINLNDNI